MKHEWQVSKKLSRWHILSSCYYLFVRKEILLYILRVFLLMLTVLKWKYFGEGLPLLMYLYKL